MISCCLAFDNNHAMYKVITCGIYHNVNMLMCLCRALPYLLF